MFHPQVTKNYDFQGKKGLSNLIQASIINKTCWFLAWLQHIKIKKLLAETAFLNFFLWFCLLWLKKWLKLKKSKFRNLAHQNFNNGKKNKNFVFYRIFYHQNLWVSNFIWSIFDRVTKFYSGKIAQIFICIENPVYLTIGPNFN